MSEEYKVSEKICDTGFGQASETLFGLECEIEAVRGVSDLVHNFWGIHEDGSLRNGGKEFVSPPNNLENTLNAFRVLHENILLGKEAFSERTSIHVHVNMQNLSLRQVKQIILLYALFEEFFFIVPHNSRRTNIHCVPLTETFIPTTYNYSLLQLIPRWQKYTALNIKPLTAFGTLEFRHLHGTSDKALLKDWLMLIENLVQVGKNLESFSPEILNDERIRELFTKLFGHFPQHAMWKMLLPTKIFNQLLDIKLSFA